MLKQFIGSWKSELDKDTTEFLDVKPYGTGLEMNDKYVTKKKIVMEEKELSGYDKKADKYISCELTKGEDIVLYTVWFISKSKFICISYSDISNPEKATIKFEGEFKSPDTLGRNLYGK